jgi:hypothetical protein
MFSPYGVPFKVLEAFIREALPLKLHLAGLWCIDVYWEEGGKLCGSLLLFEFSKVQNVYAQVS